MFELKRLSPEGVAGALEKAERYRLLNEPFEAESICRDLLETDPNNQNAIVMLLLSITDQFPREHGGEIGRARELLPRLQGEYEQAYYAGIVCERRGKALLDGNAPGSGPIVYDWLHDAMEFFEQAEKLRPAGNDDAVLRWNTCARIIMQRDHVRPAPEEKTHTLLE